MGIQHPRSQHKDRLFIRLFSEKENALSLFNAVMDTGYDPADGLEIVTLEDALYLTMKNDVSVCFQHSLVLFEQQSTWNPNAPLRGLRYYGRQMDGWLAAHGKDIYGTRLVKIPAPAYYVLYNGRAGMPERADFRLSDAFEIPSEGYEWTAHVININAGHNTGILSRCPALYGYAELVEGIRQAQADGLGLGEAIMSAVDACIGRGILKEYLLKHKGEVKDMILTEFNEELHEQTLREEGRMEGRREGRKEGRKEGRAEGRREGRMEGRAEGRETEKLSSIRTLMRKMAWTAEKAMDFLDIPAEEHAALSLKL